MMVKKNIAPDLNKVGEKNLYDILRFANAAGAIATLKKGAIPSLPGIARIEKFMSEEQKARQ